MTMVVFTAALMRNTNASISADLTGSNPAVGSSRKRILVKSLRFLSNDFYNIGFWACIDVLILHQLPLMKAEKGLLESSVEIQSCQISSI